MIFFTQYHRWKDAKYGWIKSWTVHVVSVAMENPNTVPPTMWMYMTIVERLNFSRVIYTSAVRGCWLQKLRSQDVWLRSEGLMKRGRRQIPDISWKQRLLLNSMFYAVTLEPYKLSGWSIIHQDWNLMLCEAGKLSEKDLLTMPSHPGVHRWWKRSES